MLFTKALILSLAGSAIGITGYKYYQDYQKDQEYKKLYEIFEEYNSKKILIDYDDKISTEYEPFRVIHFESLDEFKLP